MEVGLGNPELCAPSCALIFELCAAHNSGQLFRSSCAKAHSSNKLFRSSCAKAHNSNQLIRSSCAKGLNSKSNFGSNTEKLTSISYDDKTSGMVTFFYLRVTSILTSIS